ncbi:hypothetical protein ACFOEK_01515 [Litoribrevibacter euphylliae]|uniref:Cellulose biosynthesis protein BcsF n=1 Tax=Litoribrevibacter euphylliae TaxID=1834034 RepID=A0ABV7H708_9GAMM
MDYEIIVALVVIVLAMAVSGVVLRKQWADYCARVFMKRSHKSGRRSGKTHA